MLFALLTIILLTLVLYRYLLDRLKYGHVPGPTGLTSLLLLGHAYQLRGRPLLNRLKELSAEYGPVFRFDLGGNPTIFVGDLDALGEAYKREEFLGKGRGNKKISRMIRKHDPEGTWSSLSSHQDMPKMLSRKTCQRPNVANSASCPSLIP